MTAWRATGASFESKDEREKEQHESCGGSKFKPVQFERSFKTH